MSKRPGKRVAWCKANSTPAGTRQREADGTGKSLRRQKVIPFENMPGEPSVLFQAGFRRNTIELPDAWRPPRGDRRQARSVVHKSPIIEARQQRPPLRTGRPLRVQRPTNLRKRRIIADGEDWAEINGRLFMLDPAPPPRGCAQGCMRPDLGGDGGGDGGGEGGGEGGGTGGGTGGGDTGDTGGDTGGGLGDAAAGGGLGGSIGGGTAGQAGDTGAGIGDAAAGGGFGGSIGGGTAGSAEAGDTGAGVGDAAAGGGFGGSFGGGTAGDEGGSTAGGGFGGSGFGGGSFGGDFGGGFGGLAGDFGGSFGGGFGGLAGDLGGPPSGFGAAMGAAPEAAPTEATPEDPSMPATATQTQGTLADLPGFNAAMASMASQVGNLNSASPADLQSALSAQGVNASIADLSTTQGTQAALESLAATFGMSLSQAVSQSQSFEHAPVSDPQVGPINPRSGGEAPATEAQPIAEFTPASAVQQAGDSGGFTPAQGDQVPSEISTATAEPGTIFSPGEMQSPVDIASAPEGSSPFGAAPSQSDVVSEPSGGSALAGIFGGLGGGAVAQAGGSGLPGADTAFLPSQVENVNAAGWDQAFQGWPESPNVEDRTQEDASKNATPEERAASDRIMESVLADREADKAWLADKNAPVPEALPGSLGAGLGMGSITSSPPDQGQVPMPAELNGPLPAGYGGGSVRQSDVNALQQGPGSLAFAGGTTEGTMAVTPTDLERTMVENTASGEPASRETTEEIGKATGNTPEEVAAAREINPETGQNREGKTEGGETPPTEAGPEEPTQGEQVAEAPRDPLTGLPLDLGANLYQKAADLLGQINPVSQAQAENATHPVPGEATETYPNLTGSALESRQGFVDNIRGSQTAFNALAGVVWNEARTNILAAQSVVQALANRTGDSTAILDARGGIGGGMNSFYGPIRAAGGDASGPWNNLSAAQKQDATQTLNTVLDNLREGQNLIGARMDQGTNVGAHNEVVGPGVMTRGGEQFGFWGNARLANADQAAQGQPTSSAPTQLSALTTPEGVQTESEGPQPGVAGYTSLPGSDINLINSRTGQAESQEVREARGFLVDTATPSATMTQQGVERAIDGLHPEFASALAGFIETARNSGYDIGITSAYRTVSGPGSLEATGQNSGFAEVSQHGSGVAVDLHGIDLATRQDLAPLAADFGLSFPYPTSNTAELNHIQLGGTGLTASGSNTIANSTGQALADRWGQQAAINPAMLTSPAAPASQTQVATTAEPQQPPVQGFAGIEQQGVQPPPGMETTSPPAPPAVAGGQPTFPNDPFATGAGVIYPGATATEQGHANPDLPSSERTISQAALSTANSLPGSVQNPTLSPDGSFLIVTNNYGGYNQGPEHLTLIDNLTGAKIDLGQGVNMPGNNSIIPDDKGGHNVIYASDRGIASINIGPDGRPTGNPQILAQEANEATWVGQNGNFVVQAGNGIVVHNADGSTQRIGSGAQPSGSQDGQSIVFQTGQGVVISTLGPDGKFGPAQLVPGTQGGMDPSFDPSGRNIIFEADDPPRVLSIPVEGGRSTLVARGGSAPTALESGALFETGRSARGTSIGQTGAMPQTLNAPGTPGAVTDVTGNVPQPAGQPTFPNEAFATGGGVTYPAVGPSQDMQFEGTPPWGAGGFPSSALTDQQVYDSAIQGLPMLGGAHDQPAAPDTFGDRFGNLPPAMPAPEDNAVLRQPGQEAPGSGGLPLGPPGAGDILQPDQQAPGELAGPVGWPLTSQQGGVTGEGVWPDPFATDLRGGGPPATPEIAGGSPIPVEHGGELPPAESGEFADRFGNLPPAGDLINPAIAGPRLGGPSPDNIVTSSSLEPLPPAPEWGSNQLAGLGLGGEQFAPPPGTGPEEDQGHDQFPEEGLPPEEEPPPRVAENIPLPESRLGTRGERLVAQFDKAAAAHDRTLTAAERAVENQYRGNITEQMKLDLMTGKLSPIEFMAKTSGFSVNTLLNPPFGIGAGRVQAGQAAIAANVQSGLQTIAREDAALSGRAAERASPGVDMPIETRPTPPADIPVAGQPTFPNEAFATGEGVVYPGAALPDTGGHEQNIPAALGPMGTLPGGIPPVPNPEAYPPGVHEQTIPIEPAPSAPLAPVAPGAPAAPPSEARPGAPSQPGTPPSEPPGARPGAPPTAPGVPGAQPAQPLPGALAGLPTQADISYYVGTHPYEVHQLAMALKVPLMTAAMILAAQAQGVPSMAEGGRPQGPTLVGERGPEVFVPDRPGTVMPLPGALGLGDIPMPRPAHAPLPPAWINKEGNPIPAPGDWRERMPFEHIAGPGGDIRVNPTAWDAWFARLPESENVEDRRGALSGYRREWK